MFINPNSAITTKLIETESGFLKKFNLVDSSIVEYQHEIPESCNLIPSHQSVRYPQSAVALETIEDAVIVCAHRTVVAYYPDGRPVASCQIGNTERASRIKSTRKRLELKGNMVLFTPLAPECYYHWLIDTVPGLEVLKAADVSLDLSLIHI